jgi:FkbM family methyltransferase
MKQLTMAVDGFNRLRVWHRRVQIGENRLQATSFDRLVYLYLHRFFISRGYERRFLESRIRPGMHVVDVGANLGVFSHRFARCVGPSGRVTSFEPDEDLFRALESNLRANGLAHVRPFKFALGAVAGRASLSRGLLNSGDNRLSHVRSHVSSGAEETVVVALDEVIGTAPVDFIKIDAQGWEVQVIEGMRQTIARNPTLEMYIELSPYLLKAANTSARQLFALIEGMGFSHRMVEFHPPAFIDFEKKASNKFWFTNIHAYRK